MSNVVDLTELDSDSDYAMHSDAGDELYVVSVKPHTKRPKLEMSEASCRSDTDLESVIAPTSAYTKVSGNPNILMTLVEGRGFASEIAYCLFNLETSHCSLTQFSDSASYSRTIYAIVTSRPQILFVPRAMGEGKSKAMLSIRKYLPWLTIVPVERKRYSDAEGMQVLQHIALPSQLTQLLRMLASNGYIMNAKLSDLGDTVPEEFANVVIKKNVVSFTTLDLVKLNNRLASVVVEINLLTEKVSEAVALLDMIVSFASYCTLHNCVVPEFSDAISIVQGRHPVLEALGREVVPNDINTADATFTVVSGPNMGGKSTYLRQIIYMTIMAQIGSLVPAQSATLKVFDKLFVRMNNNDDMPAGESTFIREMHDMAYILQNYNKHSLLLIDELGRSTATAEGKAICQAICEELINSDATVFLTTHFLDLPETLGFYENCSRIVLSETVRRIGNQMAEDGQAVQKFKAVLGVQAANMYGIRLAEKMGFPADVIAIAKQVASEASN
ncbi:MutS protein msh4 [Coemansia sp. RSA 2336]|nr:MutS protein msh4 [Coemansia sp. RSA 2336]